MEQEELVERVRAIFEEQGFEVSGTGNRLTAANEVEKKLAVFSSGEFSADDVKGEAGPDELVFVDEPLSELQDELENEVSVIRERDEPDYDLPSYELVGDIAVINDLAGREGEEAVEGILHHHPRVKTVLLKENGLEGEFRVGDYRKLHGEGTETTHTEFGCRFKVDPTEVYFSERFSTERKRIVDRVHPGERVLVMFAGVGPFAILAAKLAEPGKVVAVEKNPVAARYLEENIELNGLEGKVESFEGDVAEIVPGLGEFDRIVMPLPESSQEFLELAMEHAAENSVIHYYRFLEDGNWGELEEEIRDAADSRGREFEVVEGVSTGERGPSVERVCVDVKIK